MPPKRKDEAFADLEQNLQNIMAGVTKPKTTTTPSTPTTSASQTTFQGNYLVRFFLKIAKSKRTCSDLVLFDDFLL